MREINKLITRNSHLKEGEFSSAVKLTTVEGMSNAYPLERIVADEKGIRQIDTLDFTIEAEDYVKICADEIRTHKILLQSSIGKKPHKKAALCIIDLLKPDEGTFYHSM